MHEIPVLSLATKPLAVQAGQTPKKPCWLSRPIQTEAQKLFKNRQNNYCKKYI